MKNTQLINGEQIQDLTIQRKQDDVIVPMDTLQRLVTSLRASSVEETKRKLIYKLRECNTFQEYMDIVASEYEFQSVVQEVSNIPQLATIPVVSDKETQFNRFKEEQMH